VNHPFGTQTSAERRSSARRVHCQARINCKISRRQADVHSGKLGAILDARNAAGGELHAGFVRCISRLSIKAGSVNDKPFSARAPEKIFYDSPRVSPSAPDTETGLGNPLVREKMLELNRLDDR
jgi:hypothetical protein